MRWRFRPSTEPPRLSQLVLTLATPPEEREVVLSDLQDEYEERVFAEGTERARRAYRRQALRSVAPGLRWRLARAGVRRRSGRPVSPAWRPEPEIPTDASNRGETMFDFWNDFKLGFRGLMKSPLVFAVAVVSLAIGIAATTTVFSMANAFLFRPPAIDLPDDVVAIFTSDDDGEPLGDTSYPDFLDLRDGVEAIDLAFLHRAGGVELEDEAGSRRLLAELVAGDYFELMDLEMTLGRGFTAAETPVGSAERLAVLSHRLWSRRFGADREILGRTVRLDGRPYTVVGVGPKGYLSRFFGLRIDVWMPMGVPGGVYHATPSALADRSDRQYRVMARLRPGTSLAAARAQVELEGQRLRHAHPDDWTDQHGEPRALTVLSEEEARLPGPMRLALGGIFGLLLVATGIILLIACSNVACLFLARAHQRRREMALRLAIGAGRRRLVRMLMAESLVPALCAGLVGSLLAAAAARAFSSPPPLLGVPLSFDFHLDHRVLLFAVLVSAAASVVFGLLPALEGATPDLVTSLKADAGSGDRRPRRFGLRRLLVVGQAAAAFAFVVAAGLTLRAVGRATAMDVGLDVERSAVMSRNLPEDRFTPEAAGHYFDDLLERLRRRPEVAAAHVTTSAELSFFTEVIRAEVVAEGYEKKVHESTLVSYNAVTPGYLEMIGLATLRGRLLDAGDRPGSPLAAVVDEAFVERFWPGDDGLGRRFRIGRHDSAGAASSQEGAFEVVGVVPDGRYTNIFETGEPFLWISLPQQGWSRRVVLHVRGRESAAEAVAALRQEVELPRGETALIQPSAYHVLYDMYYILPRTMARLLGWGGIFGMVLAVFGIYGVVAFTATLRQREMAIRQAMGARPAQVLRAVVGEGLRLASWGLVAGLAVVLPIAQLLRAELLGISPLDPLAVGGSAAVLLLAALVASLVPGRRVTSCNPMGMLRDE